MKLLLAVDSLTSAELVAGSVAARPWGAGTRALVLMVIEYAIIPIELVNETGGQMRLIKPEMERRASQVTARAVELLRQSGVEAEAEVGEGDPREVIVDRAGEWGADLVYVRSHVYRNVSRWLMGSVAREVLRSAPCSVGVLRAADDEGGAAAPAPGGMKVLLATDGSEYSHAAARSVSERRWPEGTEVKVLGVVNPNARSVYAVAEVMASEEDEAEERGAVSEAVKTVGDAGLSVAGEVAVGDAKTLIVERAKEWGAHLVVVGSHGRRGSERFFLGSVSEYVANQAHCSTEVIRRQRA